MIVLREEKKKKAMGKRKANLALVPQLRIVALTTTALVKVTFLFPFYLLRLHTVTCYCDQNMFLRGK